MRTDVVLRKFDLPTQTDTCQLQAVLPVWHGHEGGHCCRLWATPLPAEDGSCQCRGAPSGGPEPPALATQRRFSFCAAATTAATHPWTSPMPSINAYTCCSR